MRYGDLLETKKVLEIDPLDTQEDSKLLFFIEYASGIIEEILNRPGIEYKTRTEIYQGSGTQALLLRSRPVFTTPAITVLLDESANFGSSDGAFTAAISTLTYGVDYCLKIDQEDGSSRSGILYRIGNYWPKTPVRQRGYLSPFIGPDYGSIKVTYTGGYTPDSLPSPIRFACNLLVAKMRGLFPVGMEMSSEGFQDRSMTFAPSQRDYLMSLAKPHLLAYRNWSW